MKIDDALYAEFETHIDNMSDLEIKESIKNAVATAQILPTKEEYEISIGRVCDYIQEEWSEPKYRCPKCNEGGMRRNEMMICTSIPPKYKYKCNQCGHVDYQYA